MKTLFEQLSKEDQDKMKNYEYQSIAERSIVYLKSHEFVTYTPLCVASDVLDIITGGYKPLDVSEFYNLFDN
jgi:hypothetical protein